jgi:hypothetical protein
MAENVEKTRPLGRMPHVRQEEVKLGEFGRFWAKKIVGQIAV